MFTILFYLRTNTEGKIYQDKITIIKINFYHSLNSDYYPVQNYPGGGCPKLYPVYLRINSMCILYILSYRVQVKLTIHGVPGDIVSVYNVPFHCTV